LKVSIIIGTIKLIRNIPNMKVKNISYLGKLWVILGNFKISFRPIFFKKKEREYVRIVLFKIISAKQTVNFRHKK